MATFSELSMQNLACVSAFVCCEHCFGDTGSNELRVYCIAELSHEDML